MVVVLCYFMAALCTAFCAALWVGNVVWVIACTARFALCSAYNMGNVFMPAMLAWVFFHIVRMKVHTLLMPCTLARNQRGQPQARA